jgi:rhomboid protease GluP
MFKNFNFKSATGILIILNILIFAVMFLFDSSLSIQTLDAFGAKVNYKIADGQYYRLVSSMFIHANLQHLLSNMLGLYIFGQTAEYLLGRKKYLVLYFVSGLFGSLCSFMINDAVSVGASGALFALFGFNLYMLYRNPKIYKQVFGNDIIFLIGINLVLGIIDTRIDMSGHLGGLLGGFLISFGLGFKDEKTFTPKHMLVQIMAAIMILASAIGYSNHYKDSEQYNFRKGLDLLTDNKIFEAEEYFKKGYAINPNNQDFINLLEAIEEYRQEIQK